MELVLGGFGMPLGDFSVQVELTHGLMLGRLMKRWRASRFGRGHRADASSVPKGRREIPGGRVESTRCPESRLRPSRYKVIKPTQVDLALDVLPKGLDMLRTHAIAEAHHVVY